MEKDWFFSLHKHTEWRSECITVDRNRGNMVNVYIEGTPSDSQEILLHGLNLSSSPCN